MQQASEKTAAELGSGPGTTPEQRELFSKMAPDTRISKFRSDDDIDVVVAGSEAGKCTGFFHGWIPRSIGSIPVSRKIE